MTRSFIATFMQTNLITQKAKKMMSKTNWAASPVSFLYIAFETNKLFFDIYFLRNISCFMYVLAELSGGLLVIERQFFSICHLKYFLGTD